MAVFTEGGLAGSEPTRLLHGARVLTLPPGRFKVAHDGAGFDITPLDSDSSEAMRRERPTLTDLADIAARLGMRVSAPKPAPVAEEAPVVKSKAVRPEDIARMIGQDTVRVQMMLDAQSAMCEREAGDKDAMPSHTLLSGPRGTGKTTLAKITASLIGGRLVETTASAVNEVKVLGRKLAELEDDDVLFIDEIHGLSRRAQELLYTAMEDGVIALRVGAGVDTTTSSIKLKRFVLVGATTIQGELEGPMLDRFGLIGKLDYYSDDELSRIIRQAAETQRIKLEDDAADALAVRSKGTPRIALNLLKKARAFVVAMNGTTDIPVTLADVDSALELHKVDRLGLEDDERAVLSALCAKHNQGRPMGAENLAVVTGMEYATVRQIEALLLRLGLMVRTSRGRKATKAGYTHMGMKPPADAGFDIE